MTVRSKSSSSVWKWKTSWDRREEESEYKTKKKPVSGFTSGVYILQLIILVLLVLEKFSEPINEPHVFSRTLDFPSER